MLCLSGFTCAQYSVATVLYLLNYNWPINDDRPGACLRTNPKYAGGGYERGYILRMIGTHQLVYKDITRVRHVFIAFSAI